MERIRTLSQLEQAIEDIGFLPYAGDEKRSLFTLGAMTDNAWFDGSDTDPWVWRAEIAKKGAQAYGKFFGRRAGFVSRRCIPAFIAVRRDNRSLDELYADGVVSRGALQVWRCFEQRVEWTFPDLKREAGFSGQSRAFEAAVTELQGLFFVCISGQSQRISRAGEPYGWPNNDFGRMDVLFPTPEGGRMEPDEAEEYLLDCIRTVGDFPEKTALRLLRSGGVRG